MCTTRHKQHIIQKLKKHYQHTPTTHTHQHTINAPARRMASEASILHDGITAAATATDDTDDDIRDLEVLLGVAKGGGGDDQHVVVSALASSSSSSILSTTRSDPNGQGAPASTVERDANSATCDAANSRPVTTSTRMEAFEIEPAEVPVNNMKQSSSSSSSEKDNFPMIALAPSEDTLDEEFDDLESLLGIRNSKRKQEIRKQPESQPSPAPSDDDDEEEKDDSSVVLPPPTWCLTCCCCCPAEEEIALGNVRVPSPKLYAYTNGWGVVGPHWFGPPCVVGLIGFATVYFAYECSWQRGRPFSAATCIVLAVTCCYHLLNVAYRNPGIIVKGRLTLPDPLPRTWKYCEHCDYYQPPRAVHCRDCNVCIAGFDHHCVWMGTCIG